MTRRRIAVIGIGKIAQDQHLPVIDKGSDFELAATVSTRGLAYGKVPAFRSPADLYQALPEVGIVAICTPPSPGARGAGCRQGRADGKAADDDHFGIR